MKKFKWSSTLLLTSSFVVFFFACNKEASSKANYIFKAAPTQGIVASVAGEAISEQDFNKGIEADLYEAEMK